MVGVTLTIAGALAATALTIGKDFIEPRFQRFGMRFFRDLGRVKARKRLTSHTGNRVATIDILLGREDKIQKLSTDDIFQYEENDVIVDIEELQEADGKRRNDDDGFYPLWLSIRGRVYDVSAGRKFYGPGEKYHIFVGKDATRAFCTGCLEPECLISSLDNLTDFQREEADRWVEYYEFHDKYQFVGLLQNVTGHIDDLVAKAIETEESSSNSKLVPPIVPSS